MTVRLAWLADANAVSEMMRPRPDPKVAAFLDSIADEGLGIGVRHRLGDSQRDRPARPRPAPPRAHRTVPGPSRRPVRGPGRGVVCGGCAGLRADHGGQAPPRRVAGRPCSGRLPRRHCGRARPCHRDPQPGGIPEHRCRNGGSLDRQPVLSIVSSKPFATVMPVGRLQKHVSTGRHPPRSSPYHRRS